jgi:hypothetical protein
VKTNQYGGNREPFSVLYSANHTIDRPDQGLERDHAGDNRVFRLGNSPSGAVIAAIANHRPFPFRTLIVCFTMWLIATQAMIFDQIKFDERAHSLEQNARSLGAPQLVIPNEQPSNVSTDVEVQRL